MTKRSLNSFASIANAGSRDPSTTTTGASDVGKPMDFAGMDSALAAPMAGTDLGIFGNWAQSRHVKQAKRRALSELVDTQYNELTRLGKEQLIGKVNLLREELRTEWSRQYAVIAERSAAGEMQAIRRFEAVLQASRDLLFQDRHQVLNDLADRHEQGMLTDDDFKEEIQFYMGRYQQLRAEFTDLVDLRRSAVKGAFRPAAA